MTCWRTETSIRLSGRSIFNLCVIRVIIFLWSTTGWPSLSYSFLLFVLQSYPERAVGRCCSGTQNIYWTERVKRRQEYMKGSKYGIETGVNRSFQTLPAQIIETSTSKGSWSVCVWARRPTCFQTDCGEYRSYCTASKLWYTSVF